MNDALTMRLRGLLYAALLCFGATERAQAFGETKQPVRVAASLWRDLGSPSARRAHELEQQALAELHEGLRQFPADWHAFCVRSFAAWSWIAARCDYPGIQFSKGCNPLHGLPLGRRPEAAGFDPAKRR